MDGQRHAPIVARDLVIHGFNARIGRVPGIAADRRSLAHDQFQAIVAQGGDSVEQVQHVAAIHGDGAAVSGRARFAQQDGRAIRRQRRARHGKQPAVGRAVNGPLAKVA
ncbi:hypothetical protein D3C71_1218340 [compost metagenome]